LIKKYVFLGTIIFFIYFAYSIFKGMNCTDDGCIEFEELSEKKN